jgi:hypothetical protein
VLDKEEISTVEELVSHPLFMELCKAHNMPESGSVLDGKKFTTVEKLMAHETFKELANA